MTPPLNSIFTGLIPKHGAVKLSLDLRNLFCLELDSISSSTSKLLEILASNVIFLQQELYCYLQSLYFKPYLGVTHMFYNTFA